MRRIAGHLPRSFTSLRHYDGATFARDLVGEWVEIPDLLKLSRADISVWLVTFALTGFADLTVAVEIGMTIAALLAIRKVAFTTSVVAETPHEVESSRAHLLQDQDVPQGVAVFRISGPLLFGSADKVSAVLGDPAAMPPVVILRLGHMTAIDGTGLAALEDLADQMKAAGRTLILAGAREQPAQLMAQSDFDRHIGHENIGLNVTDALVRARAVLARRAS